MFDIINFLKYLVGIGFGFILGFLFKCLMLEYERKKAKNNNTFLTEKPKIKNKKKIPPTKK